MKQIEFIPCEEKTTNDRLVNLYGSHLNDLYHAVEAIYKSDDYPIKPALPLLIELAEDDNGEFPYEKADVKVMIIGRDTNNWNDLCNRADENLFTDHHSYNFTLETNEDIFAEIKGRHTESEDYYGITDIYICYHNPENMEKTPFTVRKDIFMERLKSRLPHKKIEHLWNNLNKIGCGAPGVGKGAKKVPSYIKETERNFFNVLKDETAILQPDIVVFMTQEGDKDIKEKWNLQDDDFTVINGELPMLARLNIPGIKYAARTIHPGYKSNVVFNAYTDALIDDILKHMG